ncbi:MAG: GNAT family N-acetyltransferase [Miltoncostaeaceae bacterium]
MTRRQMRVRVLRHRTSLDEHATAWGRLAVEHGNPFLTPEWFTAWAAHHADQPFVVLIHHDEELCGVVPLVARRRGLLTALGFAGDRLGDGFRPLATGPLDARGAAALAGSAIARADLPWDFVELSNCDPAGGWADALEAALGRRATSPWNRLREERPRIDAEGRSWAEYLASAVSRRTRKETRRRVRRLDESGDVDFGQASTSDAEAATDTLFRLHDLRWSARGGSSIDAPPDRATLRDFNLATAERGWLRLWLLSVDGREVAAELAWRLGDTQTHYQGGFDPEFAELSVGMVVFTSALEEAFETGAESFDLGRGIVDYKEKFMTSADDMLQRTITPGLAPSRLIVEGERAARSCYARLPDRGREIVARLSPG